MMDQKRIFSRRVASEASNIRIDLPAALITTLHWGVPEIGKRRYLLLMVMSRLSGNSDAAGGSVFN